MMTVSTTTTTTPLTQFAIDFTTGGISALIAKTSVAPIERVKLLLQIQASQKTIAINQRYKGIVDVLVRVPKEQGVLALWRGNLTNVIRYFPTQALNFAFKDTYKRFFLAGVDRKENFWKFFAGNLACGGVAGVSSMCFVYPLDFARTRLALDIGRVESREFNGLADCLVKIARSDGIFGLYRGFALSIQTVFIYRASYFGLFDTLKPLVSSESGHLNVLATFGLAQSVTTVSGMITYPWDTVRRRYMMQSGRSDVLYSSTWDCFKQLLRHEGPSALYNGALSNVLRGVGAAIVLTLYDQFHNYSRH